VTSIATGTFTVTSTRAQYTANISIPSAATTGIQIVFTVGAQTSGTWVVDTVQLEKGSTTTTFDVKPIGTELALCQRYYYKMLGTASGRASFLSGVVSTATTAIQCGNSYPVVMRSVPTVSYSGLAVSDANIAATITSITNNNSSTTNATLNVTASGGGLTAGRPGLIVSSGNATDYLDFSAEL
jgi:hypothetical protein